MTYHESKNVTNILSNIFITGIYAFIVYQRYLNGISDSTDVFKFWAITILVFIPISVVSRIIIIVIFLIISSVIQTAKGDEIDFEEFTDERDKLIELKATKISLIVFSLGFILALVTQVTGMSNHMFFITLVVFGFLSETISDLVSIVYYKNVLQL